MPANGDKITQSLRCLNGSYYMLINRDTLKYLGFTEKEILGSKELEVVSVYERSSKWGAYIGVGKKGKH